MSEKKGKSPAFQFYPKDVLSDGNAMAMPAEAFGIYMKLLCYDWIDDGLLDCDKTWRRLGGFEPYNYQGVERDSDDWSVVYSYLRAQFVEHPTKPGFLTNPRLLKERAEQKKRSEEATKSANKRWKKDGECEPDANALPTQCSSSASSSADLNTKENNKRKKRSADEPASPPDPNLHPSPDAPKHLTRKPYELKAYTSRGTNCFLGDIDVDALKHRFGSELRLLYFVGQIHELSISAPAKWRKYTDHRLTIISWDRLKTEKGLVWVERPTDGQRAGFYPHYVATKIGHEAH